MEGRLVPMALLARYTALMGADTDPGFRTVPADVEEYARVSLSLWRSPMPGTAPTFAAWVEDSHDAQTWAPLHAAAIDPGADGVTTVSYELRRRWLRVRILLDGTDVAVATWASALLETRVA